MTILEVIEVFFSNKVKAFPKTIAIIIVISVAFFLDNAFFFSHSIRAKNQAESMVAIQLVLDNKNISDSLKTNLKAEQKVISNYRSFFDKYPIVTSTNNFLSTISSPFYTRTLINVFVFYAALLVMFFLDDDTKKDRISISKTIGIVFLIGFCIQLTLNYFMGQVSFGATVLLQPFIMIIVGLIAELFTRFSIKKKKQKSTSEKKPTDNP